MSGKLALLYDTFGNPVTALRAHGDLPFVEISKQETIDESFLLDVAASVPPAKTRRFYLVRNSGETLVYVEG